MRIARLLLLLAVNAACGIKAPPRPPPPDQPTDAQTSTRTRSAEDSRSTIERRPR